MNLYKLGLSGLNAASAGLNVTGHNVNNATTAGFNRQRVLTSTAGATATSAGYFGRGVQVDTVQRQYDSFLYKQLVNGQGSSAQLSSHLNQIMQINNFLSDRTVGITPALANFFTSLNSGASNPADPASREDLLGTSQTLVTQMNAAYQQMQNQRNGLNTQISTTVEQVNSYLDRINSLNQQIVVARSKNGHEPNDLLDQRDLELSELNQLVGITYSTQGDSLNITLKGGQTLLSGTSVFKLASVQSSTDPQSQVLAYTLPSGASTSVLVEIKDSDVTGGALGGLLQFRHNSLNAFQDQLGQMAIGLAMAFNEQHKQGLDLNGNPGKDFFGLNAPTAIRNAGNGSLAEFQGEYTDANAIRASAYSIEFDGTNYKVTRLQDNAVVHDGPLGAGDELEFDGVKITLSGTAVTGDSWEFQPTRDAARDLSLLISDTSEIAYADAEGGSANGNNALALANLQTKKVLGNGSLSINELFSQIVNNVGVQTQSIQSASTAQDKLTQQHFADQQAVSGVNLDEEYVNLSMYTDQYRASSRLIDVATSIFDTLLGLRG